MKCNVNVSVIVKVNMKVKVQLNFEMKVDVNVNKKVKVTMTVTSRPFLRPLLWDGLLDIWMPFRSKFKTKSDVLPCS